MLSAAQQLRQVSMTGTQRTVMGPAVRSLLTQYGLAETSIKPSGPRKNLLKSDVQGHINATGVKRIAISSVKASSTETPTGSGSSANEYQDIPVSNMRAIIGRRLLESKTSIPHVYAVQKVDADGVNALRKKMKSDGIKVSINDFVLKACASALRAVPQVNVQWKKGGINAMKTFDISVAVATATGLITPIVFNADQLGVAGIAGKVRELAAKARDNKLKLNEFQGGTFTVSNLGMYGSISHFTAIINPPQAAIMAVGGGIEEIDWDLSCKNRFQVTLCYDGRAISSYHAHLFLEHFASSFRQPEAMINP